MIAIPKNFGINILQILNCVADTKCKWFDLCIYRWVN